MAIPNLGKLIEEKKKQNPTFLAEKVENPDETKLSKEIADLFEALFKYLEASNKQTVDILKAINHDQKDIIAHLRKLTKEDE